MMREQLERLVAVGAIVRAVGFAADEYGRHPLDRVVYRAA
jgi:hypothetical protein